MEISASCCFTGHRPKFLPWGYNNDDIKCVDFKIKLKDAVIEAIGNGYKHFISGMAIGVDQIAAGIVLELRESNNITLECAVPCENQHYRWKKSDKKNYLSIISQCDKLTVLSDEYTPDCMIVRNKYMVNKSSYVIAAWNGGKGGTYNTVMYAYKMNRKVFIINV